MSSTQRQAPSESDGTRVPVRPSVWRALSGSWAVRSVAVNAVGSGLDYAVALTLVSMLGVMTPLGVGAGVLTGATFNFLSNRAFAFRDSTATPLGKQALRFGAAIGALMVVHACAVWFLRDRMGVHLVPAKMTCDLLLLGATQPILLRYVVFPRSTLEEAPALARLP